LFQFNEWHEGTQIEPAVPKTIGNYTYASYDPDDPEFYIRRTKEWSEAFARAKQTTKSGQSPAN
jgi:glycoprotein endo-alpha-1,2-mannosidase